MHDVVRTDRRSLAAPDLLDGTRKASGLESAAAKTIANLFWNVLSLNHHFGRMTATWSTRVGISPRQWEILMAIMACDRGSGVAVKRVVKEVAGAAF